MTPEVTIGAIQDLAEGRNSVMTWIGADQSIHPLSGGLAPVLGAQEGVNGYKFKGFMAPIKHITQQSAREDGDTWEDAVLDPLETDFTVEIYGHTPASFRQIHREWFDSWDPKVTGRLVNFSRELGEWWLNCRQLKEISDELAFGPAHMQSVTYSWSARSDFPLWQSFDWTGEFVPIAATDGHFFPFLNRGNQPAWPRYLFQGPGTIQIGDGLAPASATFGPINAGQTVLIVTQPSKRAITELNTSTDLYSLLSGRFTTPIAPVGTKPIASRVPIIVTGAIPGKTKITASLTPLRNWPE